MAAPVDSVILREAEVIKELRGDRFPIPPGFRYLTALDMVVAEGCWHSPERADDARCGPSKQCFRNAGRLVLDEPKRYVYVEGFATIKDIPLTFAHAWVWDREEGRALEVTWAEPGTEYLGIPFDSEWFLAWLTAREIWGVLDVPQVILRADADPAKYTAKNLPKISP